jgi:hypothetical protein
MAHHWENTRGMFAGGKKGFNFEAFKVFTAPFSFLTNVWYPSWALTAEERREILESCFGTYGLSLAAMILSLIFAAVAAAGGFLKVREALRGIRKSMRDVWLRSTGIFFLTILFLVPLAAALAAGKLFHGRYCLVLLAPLFALTGAGITKWLSMPRARRIVGPIILLTIGCNIWFVPAFYRAQGEMIRNGPTFIPSFRKLESVYQSLKAHSGQERPIVVEVRSYSASLLPQEKPFHQAVSIRRYVAAREMWLHAAGSSSIRPAKYVLCFAADVESNDPAVGYRSNGIALVEDTSLP